MSWKRLEIEISKTKDHRYKMAYGKSNGYVTDDVKWLKNQVVAQIPLQSNI